jgi:hypothetical protein
LTTDIQADGEPHWTPERFLKKSCGEAAYLPSTYAAHASA